jgi:hypothetical protein
MPVKTIARLCSFAAAMISSSRIEPPGWMVALIMCLAALSALSHHRDLRMDIMRLFVVIVI